MSSSSSSCIDDALNKLKASLAIAPIAVTAPTVNITDTISSSSSSSSSAPSPSASTSSSSSSTVGDEEIKEMDRIINYTLMTHGYDQVQVDRGPFTGEPVYKRFSTLCILYLKRRDISPEQMKTIRDHRKRVVVGFTPHVKQPMVALVCRLGYRNLQILDQVVEQLLRTMTHTSKHPITLKPTAGFFSPLRTIHSLCIIDFVCLCLSI